MRPFRLAVHRPKPPGCDPASGLVYLSRLLSLQCPLQNVRFVRMKPGQEMTRKRLRIVFDKLGRLDVVRLSGGEPFLRTDFAEVAAAVFEAPGPECCTSPPTAPFPSAPWSLSSVSRNPERLRFMISFDGLEAEHDASRGGRCRLPPLAKRSNGWRCGHVWAFRSASTILLFRRSLWKTTADFWNGLRRWALTCMRSSLMPTPRCMGRSGSANAPWT